MHDFTDIWLIIFVFILGIGLEFYMYFDANRSEDSDDEH